MSISTGTSKSTSRIQDAGCRVRGAGCRVQGEVCRGQGVCYLTAGQREFRVEQLVDQGAAVLAGGHHLPADNLDSMIPGESMSMSTSTSTSMT